MEVLNEVHWRTRGKLLKATFPFSASSSEATYDLGMGVVRRGNNRRERYEVPAQQWADLSSADEGFGVSVLNDAKYGWDKPDDSTLRLSLLRSPRVLRKFRHQGFQDLGRHRFTYALYGHAGDWSQADTVWQAMRLNQPLLVFRTGGHDGALGRRVGFLDIDNSRVAVRAMKQAESGHRTVIRLQETSGSHHAEVRLGVPTEVLDAVEVNGLEEPLGPVQLRAGRVSTEIAPFQPKALALDIASSGNRLESPTCQPIPLPWNLAATSSQNQPSSEGMDGHGHAIPAELFPSVIHFAGVEFRLGPAAGGSPNALICQGQTIRLPAGRFNRVHLLAASLEGVRTHKLRVGDVEQTLRFHRLSGWLETWQESSGRPFHRPTLIPGSVRPQAPPVAWYASHRHDAQGRDEPYVFSYLYHHVLDWDNNDRCLLLPEAADVRIFALTLADEVITDTRCATVDRG